MRRREALKHLGTIAGAAAVGPKLLGCSSSDQAGSAALGITTIVTVMMENRSYDHYLGARALLGKGGNGLDAMMGNPDSAGSVVPVFHDTAGCVPDPPHSWDASHAQFAEGANSGFLSMYQERVGTEIPPHALGYLTGAELPFTWALADHGTVCDAWFASLLGPTWPNRAYLHSAQSGGLTTNTRGTGWTWPTIYDRLDEAGIDWAYYFSDLPVLALFRKLQNDSRLRLVNAQFFEDAANGTLPPVVFIDPAFGANDDHPPHHPMLGQQFLASIYAALANSPQWNNCLLIITYDEHGGFFDHVPPPTTADDRASEGFGQLGFRVPTLIAGPYVKQGHISSVARDHTSVLAHIESMFGLAPLTARDAAAADLMEVLDLDRLAASNPAPPAPMPAIEVDESMLGSACNYQVRELTDLELLANAGGIPARLDARAQTRDLLYTIGDTLDRLGAGRIRRGR